MTLAIYEEDVPEPKDYMKWMWGGVLLLFAALVGALWVSSGGNPQVSQCRVRHILITFKENNPAERASALELARSLRERIVSGQSFADLARQYSNDPGSAKKGGDLGYVTKGQLAKLVDEYIWNAPVGQVSEVIQTQYGFHLVRVEDRRLSKVDELKRRREEELKQVNIDGDASQTPAAP